ncbi:MAG: hypothetical protein ABSD57_07305 [Verrucomicrobiota bacterium]|jgi:hypothetical protein
MSKTNSTSLAIVQALRVDADAIQNGIERIPYNALVGMAEAFCEDIRNHCLLQKSLNSPVPELAGDDTPGAKKYPRREELKPTPEPVPSPDETETATSTKISVPDYGDAKRFAVAMGGLATAASKLFEIESETQTQEKDDARRETFGWVDEVRQSVYDL